MSLYRNLCVLCAVLSAGCAKLPSGGPNRLAIDEAATETVRNEPRAVTTNYVLVDVSAKVLANASYHGPESLHRSFGKDRRAPRPELKVNIGDRLSVVIFESTGGGLFSRGSGGSDPIQGTGGAQTLPPQQVDNKGYIAVPYAGRIRAAGRTIEQIQREIEQGLVSRAIEPQAVVTVAEQNSAEVSIFGDAIGIASGQIVNSRQLLRPSGERILEVISRSGLRVPGYEAYVTLKRGARQATVHFPVLIERSDENIYIQPGDVVYVSRVQQKFAVFGPTGSVGVTTGLTGYFPFEARHLSLTEAVAKAGGLLDTRANASHVFLYREEHRDTLVKNGVNLKGFPPDKDLIPTIYRANFRDPSIFFSASKFPMYDRDVIYVANADSVEIEKFFNFIRLFTSTAAGVSSEALVAREAVRALSQ